MVWSNDAHPFVRESRTFDMMGRLFQDRCMLNDIGVKIKLVRSKDFFYLMGAASKVKIMHVSLFVRKVKLITPSVFLPHAKILEREFTKYPIRRVVCKIVLHSAESHGRQPREVFRTTSHPHRDRTGG